MTRLRCRGCKRAMKYATPSGYGPECARKRGLLPPKKPRARAVRRPKPATVPPAADVPPGQTALDLFYVPVTLDSL